MHQNSSTMAFEYKKLVVLVLYILLVLQKNLSTHRENYTTLILNLNCSSPLIDFILYI